MTIIALIFVVLACLLGMWLRQGQRSLGLGVAVGGLLILSAINLFFGSATSPLFYAAPAAIAVLVGWSLGKRRPNPHSEERP